MDRQLLQARHCENEPTAHVLQPAENNMVRQCRNEVTASKENWLKMARCHAGTERRLPKSASAYSRSLCVATLHCSGIDSELFGNNAYPRGRRGVITLVPLSERPKMACLVSGIIRRLGHGIPCGTPHIP